MTNKPFVNPFEIPADLVREIALASRPTHARLLPEIKTDPAALAMCIDGVFAASELSALIGALDAQPWQPVGLDGIADHYRAGDAIGSWRASAYEEGLSKALYQRLSPSLGGLRVMGPNTPTDHDGHRVWRPVGINPLLRFIRYESSGLLVPHYDAPYDLGDGRRRTLVTVVVYLEHTPGAVGGATRFITDAQTALPMPERDFSDWTRTAHPEEIVASIEAVPGSALLFDHRMLHDSEPLSGTGRKTILRTDVIYERMD